jgi:3-phosphoshikimate 1-carboxyvinyltransferase
VLATQPFASVLAGDASLARRPVARIVEPLRRMGARVSARDGDRVPPLHIEGGPLAGVAHELPVASAQVASCLLLAGLGAAGETSVTLPGPARDHTERMLPAFGIPVGIELREARGPRLAVQGPAVPRGTPVRVPGDPSAAAFFLAAAAATPGARVTARAMSLNPTRTGLLDALSAMGAIVEIRPAANEGGEPVGDVTVAGPDHLVGFEVPDAWLPRLVDEVPAWAIAAASATGVSRLRGAAELRVKESDRLAAIARNLARLGVTVRELGDGLEIEGGVVSGGVVDSSGDHRIAMAFAVIGTRARGPVTVDDARSIATSFPGFVSTLRRLGGNVEASRFEG